MNSVCVMYKSFVTTAQPPTQNSGDFDFSSSKSLLEETSNVGINLCYLAPHSCILVCTAVISAILAHKQTPTLTQHCGDDAKVKSQNSFPTVPSPPPWAGLGGVEWGGHGYKWLLHKKQHDIRINAGQYILTMVIWISCGLSIVSQV